jgi:hypothetical protein
MCSFAIAAVGAGLVIAFFVWRLIIEQQSLRRLREAWRQRLRRGFMSLLLDEELASMLIKLHRTRLPGIGLLKGRPESLPQHLATVAMHGEALAKAGGHVERLRRQDLRLMAPFGDQWPWTLAMVCITLWSWGQMHSLAHGTIGSVYNIGGLGYLALLLMQIGPAAMVEFSRLGSRVNVCHSEMLAMLTSREEATPPR